MQHFSFTVPTVWEASSRIRFGVERTLLSLRLANRAEIFLMHRIRSGVDRAELWHYAHHLEIPSARVHGLLRKLEPVLAARPAHAAPLSPIHVIDEYRAGARIAGAFSRLGFSLHCSKAQSRSRPPIVVTVDRFGYNISRVATLFARDDRVFPIRFTDRVGTIGPLMDGDDLCARCLHLHDADSAPEWLNWADQLVGRPIPVEQTFMLETTAVLAAGFLAEQAHRHVSGEQLTVTYSIDGAIETVARNTVKRHPACDSHPVFETLATPTPVRSPRPSKENVTAPVLQHSRQRS